MYKFFSNRFLHIFVLLVLVFSLLTYALYQLTIVNGEKYFGLSLEQRIKKLEVPAERGEITDSKGNVLAYNEVGYSVKLNSSLLPQESLAEQCIKMYDFLKSRNEKQVEFPIYIENGEYKYRFDENIKEWLKLSGYGEDWSAREVFEYEKAAFFIDKNLSDYEAMKLLNSRSIYLPISTIGMKYTEQYYKEEFLDSYGLSPDISAKEAFQAIRSTRSYRIPEEMSDEDAYKVLIYRHEIRNKGFLRYEPMVVAPNVSLETSILISERGHEFPGLYSDFTTRRIYKTSDLASHVVGYIGRISNQNEIDYYVDEKGYNRNDFVGKTGIEYVYEELLHGQTGYKYIETDVYGKYVGEVDPAVQGLEIHENSKGTDLKLTIHLEFQEKLKNILKKNIEDMQKGAKVTTQWGTHKFRDLPNVETAAVVIADIHTGKILGSYSYPSYDPMVFMDGISKDDWANLNPTNSRNPISARPLLDLTARMAVQPGSTYKMATAYAAMEQGLDPYSQIFADGHIEIGQRTFGCWLWNQHRGRHGWTDLKKAIRDSCNYYFFCVANAYDYYHKQSLNYAMDNNILVESSRRFGFDKSSGAEVPEVIMGIPDVEHKVQTALAMLKLNLDILLPEYFDQELLASAEKRQTIVKEIMSWAEENPPRAEIIDRLLKLGSNPDYTVTEKFADTIKYDYFNMMEWYEGDTMNLSIGQGEHAYTPLQMLRYTAIIANGGYPVELTYIDSIDGKPYEKNQNLHSFDERGLLDVIKEGMYLVVNDPGTFIYEVYKNFPIKVAGKTGTAEKEGRIPPLDEVEYILSNLQWVAPEISIDALEAETTRILKERSEEMSQMEHALHELEESGASEEEIEEMHHKMSKVLNLDRLNKGDAMREAIKHLTGGRVKDEDIDKFRPTYESFSWFIGYAPYDNPEVAFAVLVPQGGEGHNASVIARDILAAYYGLDKPDSKDNEEK